MKEKLIQFLIGVLALAVLPIASHAQDMTFDEDEVSDEATDEATDEDSMDFSEDESDPDAADDFAPESEGEATTEADISAALGEDFTTALDLDAPSDEEGAAEMSDADRHPIWAVQQVYALRARRFDFQPSFGLSLNDPYVQHQAISAAVSYYLTEVLAVGASFNFYRWLDAETSTNFSVRRATHQAVPINEYYWGAQVNFTYVPIYGKMTMLKEWILHWDVWLIGGVGAISTRPIPTIDPDYRKFEYEPKFSFNVGIGARMFMTRFLAIYVELRDYIFPEALESRTVFATEEARSDPNAWLDDDHKITNNFMLHAGVSIFFPLVFDYKLPK